MSMVVARSHHLTSILVHSVSQILCRVALPSEKPPSQIRTAGKRVSDMLFLPLSFCTPQLQQNNSAQSRSSPRPVGASGMGSYLQHSVISNFWKLERWATVGSYEPEKLIFSMLGAITSKLLEQIALETILS